MTICRLFCLALLAAPVCGHAATFTVLSTADAGPGSLRQAVLDANEAPGGDEITFDVAGVFGSPQTITLLSPLEIRGQLMVSAPANAARQVTLRGAAGGTRLVEITLGGSVVSLKDFILENGSAATGAAVHAAVGVTVTLTTERCTFRNHTGTQSGAAVSISTGILEFTDCIFRDNTSPESAVLALASGTAAFTGCTFENNIGSRPAAQASPRSGGLILQNLGSLRLTDCTFRTNTSVLPLCYLGDYRSGGVLEASGCVFEDNPGPVFRVLDKEATLTSCRFERNGQIIAPTDSYSRGGLTMTDCVCLNNTGLITWPAGGMLLEDCRMEDNAAGVIGNAVLRRVKLRRNAGMVLGSVDAEDSEFDSATAGGLGSSSAVSIVLRRCAVTRNTPTQNGVTGPGLSGTPRALMLADSLLLESCTVSENAGLIQSLTKMQLFNCTLTDNLQPAANPAGLLLYAGPDEPSLSEVPVTLKNCVFAGNSIGTERLIRAVEPGAGGDYIRSLGGNFIDRTDFLTYGPGGPHSSDQIATPPGNVRLDPLLGPLQDWGGAGLSRMPLAGSPLIDAGFSAPSAPDYQEPFQDQTGRARVRGTAVETGAVELRSRFTVMNTNDSGPGSLREAAALAAGLPAPEIVFASSVFGTTGQTITLTSGQIILTSGVTITGPEIGVAISGGNSSRLFSLTGANGVYEMERILFTRGNSTADGGAVRLSAGSGARLTLRRCMFSQNAAAQRGGGLFADGGTVFATDCVWFTNTGGTTGGGIALAGGAVLNLTNSTLNANSAAQGGGGLFSNASTATLIHCTVTGNTADSDSSNDGNGGGLRVNSAPALQLGATVVAGNADASGGGSPVVHPDISGAFVSLGHNFISRTDGQTTGVTHGTLGDQAGTVSAPLLPQLGAMADNGGLFRSQRPQNTSPLVNAGDASLLTHAAWPEPPLYDVRDQFRNLLGAPDIGAVETPDAPGVRLVRGTDTVASEHPDEGTASWVLQRSRPGTTLDVLLGRPGASTAVSAEVQLSCPQITHSGPDSWRVIMGPDVLSRRITLRAVDDAEIEPAETFILAPVISLTYGIDVTPAADRTLTILSNDALVTATTDSGPGSLREAVDSVRGLGKADVWFDPAVFSEPRTISLLTPLDLTSADLSIHGPTRIGASVTLDGGLASELLTVNGTATLSGLNLTRGRGRLISLPDQGTAAIMVNGGSLLRLDGCCVYDCEGVLYGGAVFCFYGARLEGLNSTFARNRTTGHGGAIHTLAGARVELTHCTLAENRADSDLSGDGTGGAMYLGAADAVLPEDATLLLTGCLLSQNTDARAHVEVDHESRSRGIALPGDNSAFTSGGGNFISTAFDQGLATPSDYIADQRLGPSWFPAAARLLPLGNYGGPTLTYAFCADSPAAALVAAPLLPVDQRGLPRGTPTAAGAYAFSPESYDFWKAYTMPAGTPLSGPLDDADGDGTQNLLEQHMGTSPISAADYPAPPVLTVQPGGGDAWLRSVRYQASPRVDTASLFVEQSEDLVSWIPSVPVGPAVRDCIGPAMFITQSLGNSFAPRVFFRLAVSAD